MIEPLRRRPVCFVISAMAVLALILSLFFGFGRARNEAIEGLGVSGNRDFNHSCAVVSLAVAGKVLGIDCELEDVRQRMRVDQMGRSSMNDIIEAATDIGFQSRGIQISTLDLIDTGSVLVAHLDTGHWFVIYRNAMGVLVACDLPNPLFTFRANEISERWKGNCVLLCPTEPDLQNQLRRLNLPTS